MRSIRSAGEGGALAPAAHAVGAACVVALLAAGWLLGHRPLAFAAEQARLQAAELDALGLRRAELAAEHGRRQRALVSARQEWADLRARVPATAGEVGFLTLLSDAAREEEVELGDFRVAGVRPHGEFQVLEVQTSARGGYGPLCAFLDRIERLPRLCRVPRLTLDADEADAPHHRLTLTIHAFWDPAAAQAARPLAEIRR